MSQDRPYPAPHMAMVIDPGAGQSINYRAKNIDAVTIYPGHGVRLLFENKTTTGNYSTGVCVTGRNSTVVYERCLAKGVALHTVEPGADGEFAWFARVTNLPVKAVSTHIAPGDFISLYASADVEIAGYGQNESSSSRLRFAIADNSVNVAIGVKANITAWILPWRI